MLLLFGFAARGALAFVPVGTASFKYAAIGPQSCLPVISGDGSGSSARLFSHCGKNLLERSFSEGTEKRMASQLGAGQTG